MRVLKIGGSALTDKEGVEELKSAAVSRIAAEISESPENLILVHGAGSFGHPHVENYLTGGPEERLLGASKTHRAVSILSDHLVAELTGHGVPALPVRPLSCGLSDGGRLTELYLGAVREMLNSGVLPVLHGDVVMDRGDVSVVSGDEVVAHVADALDAERVGYGTDVAGVLDGDGQVIPVLNKETLNDVEFYSGTGTDITGGMKGKVDSLMRSKIKGSIFDATEPDNVARFLKGEHLGTEVSP